MCIEVRGRRSHFDDLDIVCFQPGIELPGELYPSGEHTGARAASDGSDDAHAGAAPATVLGGWFRIKGGTDSKMASRTLRFRRRLPAIGGEFRIEVMDQMRGHRGFLIRQQNEITCLLENPGRIGMGGHVRDDDAARADMDEEQDEIINRAARGPNFLGEEVAC